MATTTVFGTGGFDPLMTNFEKQATLALNGAISRQQWRYQKKAMDYQSRLNQQQATWSNLNSAKQQVQGFRNANLNPILVATGGLTGSAAQGVGLSAPQGGTHSAFDFSANADPSAILAFKQLIDTNKNIEADTELKKGQAKVEFYKGKQARSDAESTELENRLSNYETKSKLNAWGDAGTYGDSVNVPDDKNYGYGYLSSSMHRNYSTAYKNAWERERFTNSREHAVLEDSVNALHGGSSAYRNYQSGREARSRRWYLYGD